MSDKVTKTSFEIADMLVGGLSLYFGEPPTWEEVHKMIVSAAEFARSQEAAKWEPQSGSNKEVRIHKKCGRSVSEEDVSEGYSFQCPVCDEDLYTHETMLF